MENSYLNWKSPRLRFNKSKDWVVLQSLTSLFGLSRRFVGFTINFFGHLKIDFFYLQFVCNDRMWGGKRDEADPVGVVEDEDVLTARSVLVEAVELGVVPLGYRPVVLRVGRLDAVLYCWNVTGNNISHD